ncbi:hypothetical protein [Thermogemmatispora carboxidivorans]|uniref:hypothetical protein n=1 Tax=Thermogemmatispora carboxidivorans TaxID=1382306 RepID=UPI000699353F|nr:hypothetical protein [Thermogemmatispora carboxidivorans]
MTQTDFPGPLDPTLRPQLEALLQAIRQHLASALPPCWLLVPATQLSALRQTLAQGCLQTGLPWLWLPVVPITPAAAPHEVAPLLEEGERCSSPEEAAATWPALWRLLLGAGPLVVVLVLARPDPALVGPALLSLLRVLSGPGRLLVLVQPQQDPPARRVHPLAALVHHHQEESGEPGAMGLA